MKIEKTEKFQTVKPDENMVLTNYTDDMEIQTYSSFNECICPLSCDLKHLREITKEQDNSYKLALEEFTKSL